MENYFEENIRQEDNPINYAPPQFKDKDESPEIGVIRELSPKKVLEQVRMNLKGYFWDYETKKYVKIEGMEPLMNEKGIGKFLQILSAAGVTDLVTFSNYTAEEIPALINYVCEETIPTIHLNWKEYGINEKSDLPILNATVMMYGLAALKKGLGAGDRGVIGRTISETIMTRAGVIPSLREEKKGFFNSINPFARR